MDIEFHYYMTYLIATHAGFAPADAATIATASQEVDDNHIAIVVNQGTPEAYASTVSQTMDITKPHHDLRIYPIFHFIPGEPNAPSARRQDGQTSVWMTTPNSPLAQAMLQTALSSGSLHRIGASSHAYVDTWAHQNFIGKDDPLNEMIKPDSLIEEFKQKVFKIGHALANHDPDIPDLIWTDGRLATPTVVNADRFMDAAQHLYAVYCQHTKKPVVSADVARLVGDLRADIGTPSPTSASPETRISRYKARALQPAYGGHPIPDYREGAWQDAAFAEQRANLGNEIDTWVELHTGLASDVLTVAPMTYTWKNPATRQDTDWFKFQEAVKAHLDECWGLLVQRIPQAQA
ncbi:MAG TPA: DUF6765 family protein [Novosphingobium sp.]|nr:DUF6765 family protein [Novosphingobium sp.]